jgi:hypothetical protein
MGRQDASASRAGKSARVRWILYRLQVEGWEQTAQAYVNKLLIVIERVAAWGAHEAVGKKELA